jgi:hypothetical protein
VEDLFVDAAEKALLGGVDQALNLLVPQVAEGFDDDSEHDIEKHDQAHQEEEHVHGVAGPTENWKHFQSVEQSFFVSPSSMSPENIDLWTESSIVQRAA